MAAVKVNGVAAKKSDGTTTTEATKAAAATATKVASTARTRTSRAAEQDGRKQQNQQQTEKKDKKSAKQEQEREELSLPKKITVDCVLYLIKAIIATYDFLTWPIYYVVQGVGERKAAVEHLRSVQVDPRKPDSPWHQIDIEEHQLEIERQLDSNETYDAMMKRSFAANATYQVYAYRQVLEETWTKRPDNPDKLIRRVRLSDYKWITYEYFERQIEAARKGLLRKGVRAGQRVILFADTRPEWQICSQALIRLGAIVGTMYSTLGIEGIVHTVNETEAALIIAQGDKVGRLIKLAPKLPKLKEIIYFEPSLCLPRELGGADASDEQKFYEAAARPFKASDVVPGAASGSNGDVDSAGAPLACMNFCALIRSGLEASEPELRQLERDNERTLEKLGGKSKDSIAVIMYTSGSTGIPKGVQISHGNIMATIKAFSYVVKDFIKDQKNHIWTAYLPLAHIFEFCIESTILYHGARKGFASPHTLMDKSPGLAPGEVGDLSKLKPTVMIMVPLILDRIVQGIKQVLSAQSYFKEQFVSYLIEYKSYWQRRHYDTPLVNKLVCAKMGAALGGKAQYIICGSAPLSGQTQTFVRAALNLKLLQGFGTTETCAATSAQLFDDQTTGNVGPPVSGAQIKLEPWLEGNYQPTDEPNPRGEIVVGGQMIAHGYYKLDETTREAFYVDDAGTRWYRTGDIGEMLPNGQLKIIDRKKDLVKLQNGEYISLGRVESTLKSNPYTDNFCVYANSNYNYIVALGPANEAAICDLAQQIVDESERKLSPAMMRRMGANSSSNLAQVGAAAIDESAARKMNGFSSASDKQSAASAEKATPAKTSGQTLLLVSGDARAQALEELKEVLTSYESDRLNNNMIASERRRSSVLASSGDEQQKQNGVVAERPAPPPPQRPRADSGVLPTLESCMNARLNRLCENKLIQERVLAYITRLASERNLMSLEVPKKLMLLAEDWTEDKNLVTAAMKIRRNYIYKRYERELEQIYAGKA